MDTVIVWSRFVGAWLLVAGPLYQGAIELLEQDRLTMTGGAPELPPPPPPPSAWWWLVPPVMFVLRRRRSRDYHRKVLVHLTPRQRATRAGFLHKAGGWFVVATGGSLIAVSETGDLVEHYEWPAVAFALILVVTFALVGVGTVLSVTRRSGREQHQAESIDVPAVSPTS